MLEHRWNEYVKNNFISPSDLNSKGGTTESLQLIQPNLTDPTNNVSRYTRGYTLFEPLVEFISVFRSD